MSSKPIMRVITQNAEGWV